jgi:Ca2+-binding EF-hand superfamily protein
LSLGAAAAEGAGDAAARAFKRLDRNGDGVVTFEEFVAASDARLAGMDRNGDGNISRDEFMDFHAAQELRRVDRVFAALDTKKTGRLTETQLAAAKLDGPEAQRLLRCDLDKDGAITKAEYLECRRRIALRWMERIFAKYDTNGDGLIGREERVSALRDFFTRLDADGDGKIVPAEFAAAQKRWAERRQRAGDAPAGRTAQPSSEFDDPD